MEMSSEQMMECQQCSYLETEEEEGQMNSQKLIDFLNALEERNAREEEEERVRQQKYEEDEKQMLRKLLLLNPRRGCCAMRKVCVDETIYSCNGYNMDHVGRLLFRDRAVALSKQKLKGKVAKANLRRTTLIRVAAGRIYRQKDSFWSRNEQKSKKMLTCPCGDDNFWKVFNIIDREEEEEEAENAGVVLPPMEITV